MEKAYTGECINVMTQELQTEDGSLPQGLTIQNAYTELQKGSKNIVVVVRNSTAYPQMLWKKAPVARAVAAPQCQKHHQRSGCDQDGTSGPSST